MVGIPDTSIGAALHQAALLGSLTFDGGFGKLPEQPPLEPVVAFFEAGGLRFHSLSWPGEGDPILLLHGLNSNSWSWGRVGGLLGNGRPVIAITMPGHGASDPSPKGYSTEAMAEALLPAVDHVAPQRLSLVGHSFGGKIAVALAAMLGERLRCLVLADPVLPQGLNRVARALPRLAAAVFAPERGPFQNRAEMEASLRSLFYLRRWGDVEQRIALESFVEDEQGVWRHRLGDEAFKQILFGSLQENSASFLKDIRCPVLLIRPTLTISFLPGEVTLMRKQLQKLVVCRISGDHVFPLTNPLDTAKSMNRFFGKY